MGSEAAHASLDASWTAPRTSVGAAEDVSVSSTLLGGATVVTSLLLNCHTPFTQPMRSKALARKGKVVLGAETRELCLCFVRRRGSRPRGSPPIDDRLVRLARAIEVALGLVRDAEKVERARLERGGLEAGARARDPLQSR